MDPRNIFPSMHTSVRARAAVHAGRGGTVTAGNGTLVMLAFDDGGCDVVDASDLRRSILDLRLPLWCRAWRIANGF